MGGCPYNVPHFEYNKLYGQIRKCELCNQAGVERVDKGQMTGCAEVCPTGSTLFGPREALLQEARRRMQLKPGDIYKYPKTGEQGDGTADGAAAARAADRW